MAPWCKVGVEDFAYNLLGDAAGALGNDHHSSPVAFTAHGDYHPGIVYFPFCQGVPVIVQDVEESLYNFIRISIDGRIFLRNDCDTDMLIIEIVFYI